MLCWFCAKAARGSCRFCARGLCEDHAQVRPVPPRGAPQPGPRPRRGARRGGRRAVWDVPAAAAARPDARARLRGRARMSGLRRGAGTPDRPTRRSGTRWPPTRRGAGRLPAVARRARRCCARRSTPVPATPAPGRDAHQQGQPVRAALADGRVRRLGEATLPGRYRRSGWRRRRVVPDRPPAGAVGCRASAPTTAVRRELRRRRQPLGRQLRAAEPGGGQGGGEPADRAPASARRRRSQASFGDQPGSDEYRPRHGDDGLGAAVSQAGDFMGDGGVEEEPRGTIYSSAAAQDVHHPGRRERRRPVGPVHHSTAADGGVDLSVDRDGDGSAELRRPRPRPRRPDRRGEHRPTTTTATLDTQWVDQDGDGWLDAGNPAGGAGPGRRPATAGGAAARDAGSGPAR